MRVRTQKYKVGNWVYYFNPRKFAGRQDKWRRKFSGPFLVVKVIGPVNVMVQRTKRTRPFCTHVDKLKPFVADEMPNSWLLESEADCTLDFNTSKTLSLVQLLKLPSSLISLLLSNLSTG